jgi:hypothetical protein
VRLQTLSDHSQNQLIDRRSRLCGLCSLLDLTPEFFRRCWFSRLHPRRREQRNGFDDADLQPGQENCQREVIRVRLGSMLMGYVRKGCFSSARPGRSSKQGAKLSTPALLPSAFLCPNPLRSLSQLHTHPTSIPAVGLDRPVTCRAANGTVPASRAVMVSVVT